MASLIESLIDNLTEQCQTYDEVLKLQQPKMDAIVGNQLDEVQRVTKREHEYAGQLARLERERGTIIEDIALVLNKEPKDLTIAHLNELLQEGTEEHKRLASLRETLITTMRELKEINQQNEKLIHHALDYIDFTVNALHTSRSMPEGHGYAAGGQAYDSSGVMRNYFDAKQ